MQTKVNLGTVVSGTMQPRDLIPIFARELRASDLSGVSEDHFNTVLETLAEADRWVAAENADSWPDEDPELEDQHQIDGGYILDELFEALDALAPPYCYFGAHPGDGSDYGFWLHEDFQQMLKDDDALIVSDMSEVPGDYAGEVLHVNDHGNCTLYNVYHRQDFVEVWAVV